MTGRLLTPADVNAAAELPRETLCGQGDISRDTREGTFTHSLPWCKAPSRTMIGAVYNGGALGIRVPIPPESAQSDPEDIAISPG